jgi:phospholipid/cholesterol/gamma-HCH transport system substrate-binding protein
MNTARVNYVAAGGFVALFLIGMVVAIALLTGRTGSTDDYFSVYNNVTGVKFGTLILYEGYPIGQVEEVTPVAKGGAMLFRVDYSVQEGWKIPDDSIARIGAAGLLSAITINIDAGSSPSALKPGSMVRGLEAADLFAVVGEVAGQVSTIAENDIRPLLRTINTTVESLAGTVSKVGTLVDVDGTRMIQTFAKLADQLNEKIPTITENVDASAANFASLSKDLNETRGKLDSMLSKSESILGDNQADVRKSIEDLRYVTDSLARHIDSVNQNIEGTARNMYEFSREIRKNPSVLLSGGAPKDKGGK